MKIGLIGFPQTGKKTLFGLLANKPVAGLEVSSTKEPVQTVAEIKDPRFDRLTELYQPAKKTRAKIDILLMPTLEKKTIREGEIFSDIKELDAICHIIRAFKDDSVYHIEGTVDPKRDIDVVNSELILHDLLFIEKRLERLDKKMKQINEEAAEKEKQVLSKLQVQLEKEVPLRLCELSGDEQKLISSYPFITRKNLIVVLNVSEEDLPDETLLNHLRKQSWESGMEMMQVSAKVEAEIAKFESESERAEFLKELGIKEPAINALTRLCMKALNLISFYTVGADEVKQWNVKAGSTAPQAAGAIHSELEKGFIRAELMKYDDLIRFGTEEEVKEAGKFFLKGKDYIVEDGDILSFRCS